MNIMCEEHDGNKISYLPLLSKNFVLFSFLLDLAKPFSLS